MSTKRTSHRATKAPSAPISFETFSIQGAVLSLILAMIVLVPLVSGTDYLKNFGKPLVFEVLGSILLAVLASQISFGKQPMNSLKARLAIGPTVPIIAMVVYATLLYFFSPSQPGFELTERAELFRLFFCAVVYVAIALYLQGTGRLQLLVDVLLGVGAAVAILSLASIGVTRGTIVVHGTFGTHETLGSFLLLVLPIALPVALTDLGEQKRQIFAQVVTLLIAAALLMAHTRAAWLGSAIALFVLSVLYWKYQTDKTTPMTSSQRAAMMIGPPLIMAAAVALFLLTSQQTKSIIGRAGTVTNLSNDESAQIRHKMAEGAMHMIRVKPVFGWGVGSYPLLSYGFTGEGRTADEIKQGGVGLDNSAHSFYLQYTAEEGLVGMAIFVGIVLMFLFTTLTSLPQLEKGLRKTVVIGCIAACIGQLVDASISPSYNLPAISMFQFIVFGIGILAARGLDFSPTVSSNSGIPKLRVRRRRESSHENEFLR
jgi:O-antigen ligase